MNFDVIIVGAGLSGSYLSRKIKVKHYIFASTSSVYGNQFKFPTNEKNNTDKPLSS